MSFLTPAGILNHYWTSWYLQGVLHLPSKWEAITVVRVHSHQSKNRTSLQPGKISSCPVIAFHFFCCQRPAGCLGNTLNLWATTFDRDCTGHLVGGNLSPNNHSLTQTDFYYSQRNWPRFANSCLLIYKHRQIADTLQSIEAIKRSNRSLPISWTSLWWISLHWATNLSPCLGVIKNGLHIITNSTKFNSKLIPGWVHLIVILLLSWLSCIKRTFTVTDLFPVFKATISLVVLWSPTAAQQKIKLIQPQYICNQNYHLFSLVWL